GHVAIENCLEAILGRLKPSLESDSPEQFWGDFAWLEKRSESLEKICVDGLEGEAARLARAVAELVNFKAILVAAFLPPLRQELQRAKTEEGLYDFDDMITQVAETLESPQGEGLVQRLRERFEIALIDEFQDTDRQQWGIFSRVFLNSPGSHRLFLVGDPKQAIYGFRGGDLPTYEAALQALQAQTGREPLVLEQNFRSTPNIIQVTNALLRESEGTVFFSGANADHYRHPVTCGRPSLRLMDAENQDLPALRMVDVAVGREKARNTKLQAARALAEALKETLAVAHFNGSGRPTRLRYEDVFVLTQTLKEGRPIAQALKEVGIPSMLYRQNGLFDGPEAAACRDILLAIETPFDECRRAKALLGPFFGLSFTEAEGARELPEGHPILALLFGWRELAQSGRFGELFNRLVAESGVSQRLLFLEENQRTLTNLQHILELLQQEALGGHSTLADLAIQVQRWIDGQERPSVEDGETQRLERQGGAVQILTMHKAKGLQAPIVVLFGGTGKGSGGGGLVHRYHRGRERRAWVGSVKAAPAEVRAWIEAEAQEEWERLAYVALTRAEAQLLLPRYVPGAEEPSPLGNFEKSGNPKGGLYRTVNLRLQSLLGPAQEPRSHDGIEQIPPRVEGLPASVLPPLPWDLRLPPPLARPDFLALRRRGCPTWVFSYSGLQQGLERIGTNDHELEDVKETTLPGGPKGGKKFGTQVHAFLQRVDLESFQGRDLAAWMALPATTTLAEACLAAEDRSEALRWAHAAMTRPIRLPNGGTVALSQSEQFLRELDFITPYPERSDYLTGSIDLLFQTGGRTHVLDWKTNRLAGYDAAHLEETVQGHYLLQVKIYTVTACRFLGITDGAHYDRAFGGVVYVFLRGLPEGEGVWTCRPSWEEVQGWERDISALQPQRLIPVHAGGERDV
ncbi:MAG: UvrD-helicase domain-containing protein, partial [Holophaga sp.]|nr:UvrD-helicase domain-containing protein [Holophaga sp.]